jgi:hypothetical protein
MKQEVKILYADAAEQMLAKVYNDNGDVVKEFPVWKGARDGRHYSDEDSARRNNSTHKLCGCGKEMPNGYYKCDGCQREATRDRWLKMPHEEWDGVRPICLIDADEQEYFFCEEDLLDYCENHECEPDGLMLVFCEANHLSEIDFEYWDDVFPPDCDPESILSKELLSKLDELNKIIKDHRPVSYSPGKIRTSYKPE